MQDVWGGLPWLSFWQAGQLQSPQELLQEALVRQH